jgi:hypothetical protein
VETVVAVTPCRARCGVHADHDDEGDEAVVEIILWGTIDGGSGEEKEELVKTHTDGAALLGYE